MRVPICLPWFDAADKAAVVEPLDTGWVVQGPRVAQFEGLFAEWCGARRALACTSATTALHLSLAALDVGPGDEVLVPAFTWVATANAVLYCGATPVLCDVSPETFNVLPAEIERRITPRTRAIIPVHLFGLPAELGPVLAHGVPVIEDAACGFGARIDGRHVGTFGVAGAFSFHPRKALTTGEGGMVITDDPAMAERVACLRNHGGTAAADPRAADRGAFLMGDFDALGFNYRMTDLQGALGVSQMAKAVAICERRAALAARYEALLGALPGLATPQAPAGVTHGWQSYVCRVTGPGDREAVTRRRNAIMSRLEAQGVSTRPGTHAVHMLGYYRERYGFTPEDYPGAALAQGSSLALPLYPTLTHAEQDYVVDQLRAALLA
jgi:perosamine synthetase